MAFQNPAQNYSEHRLNLGDMVYLSPHSTYLPAARAITRRGDRQRLAAGC